MAPFQATVPGALTGTWDLVTFLIILLVSIKRTIKQLHVKIGENIRDVSMYLIIISLKIF